MDKLLGLPRVNLFLKYLLLIWLIMSAFFSMLLTTRSVNQLSRVTESRLSATAADLLPFAYDFNYREEIEDQFVFAILGADAAQYLFSLLLVIGTIELSSKVLKVACVGFSLLSAVGTLSLLLLVYVYNNQVNQVTFAYLSFNVLMHILRAIVTTILAMPVKRQVSRRKRTLQQLFGPSSGGGSDENINATSAAMLQNFAQQPLPPTAPPAAYHYH